MLPKKAGPCGHALCNCHTEILLPIPGSPTPACCMQSMHAPASVHLVSGSAFRNASFSIAFQALITAVDGRNGLAMPNLVGSAVARRHHIGILADQTLSSQWHDRVPTPPPKL